MKKLILLLAVFCSLKGMAQIYDPVDWSTSVQPVGEGEYELIVEAEIESGWHLYAQNVPEDGPVPTTFTFGQDQNFELIGPMQEEEGHIVDDPIFKMKIKFFEDHAAFKQRIKTSDENLSKLQAEVEFMVCNDKQCLPPSTVELEFKLKANEEVVQKTEEVKVGDSQIVNQNLYGMVPGQLQKANNNCGTAEVATEGSEGGQTLWSIFGLGFIGGLLALLTPCVFPIIPLTVSFFTKSNGSGSGIGKAILYGAFILMVYLLLSVPFHLLDSVNPDILNEISTNVWLNVAFFVIFMFFAFSFFGYYELRLPSSWTSHTTKGEDIGGVLGIFFMALTLAIVSFSCTGPILGSLLAGSLTADGGAWQLTAGMAGFGLALGLPFALFAMFPNMLHSLPKSGGWLNTVKVVLGFLELALAFKFLSNADLVQHWGILKIEVFLGLWIVIFIGLALYFFGKVRFANDAAGQKISKIRIGLGTITAGFAIYLATGFTVNQDTGTYHSLKLLSGLAPPVGYSILYPNNCPNDLNCFKDLKEGIAYAEKVNKPIILDFTGYACVNCRKMEEHVWPEEKVGEMLSNDFVLISLYVDNKEELPAEEQVMVERVNGGSRQLKNYGHKWANFQTQFFQTNSQPYYVILSPDGKKVLNQPVGYTPDGEEYTRFLECGLQSFQNSKLYSEHVQ